MRHIQSGINICKEARKKKKKSKVTEETETVTNHNTEQCILIQICHFLTSSGDIYNNLG